MEAGSHDERRRMTLSDFAAIGTMISSVAVLVSLVFLTLQMRQSVKNQQSLMQNGRAQQLSHWLEYIAKPEVNRMIIGGNAGDLDLEEWVRYNSTTWSILVSYENNFIQHRAGMLDHEQYDATLGSLKFQCSLPGFRANWKIVRPMFGSRFAAFLDELIRDTPVAVQITKKSHTAWRALAAKEIAAGTTDGAVREK
jgi:hypothetical protein